MSTTTTQTTVCSHSAAPGSKFVQLTSPEESFRRHLRSRSTDLKSLIAALTAELKLVQGESDSITYPVLTLPNDITIAIFQRCIPSTTLPRPSASTAPLLLSQICRQWRQIALGSPELWWIVAFGDDSSIEILKIWLRRAGNMPLHCSLQSKSLSRAAALMETSLLHSHHWQDMTFTLPLTTFSMLGSPHRSFPMLQKITLQLEQRAWNESFPDPVSIQNSPLLREVHISTLPHLKFDLPWIQLTALTLHKSMNVIECMSFLRECPGLVQLVVHTSGSATHDTSHLIMHSLESFTCNTGNTFILDHLTLPRLQRLTVDGIVGGQNHETIFESFLRRSACGLQYLALSMSAVPETALRLFLHAADSVTEAALRWGAREPGHLFAVLQFDVLPHLSSIHIRGGRLSHGDYNDFVEMLRVRRGRGTLDFVTLEVQMYSELDSLQYGPGTSAIAQLRALAADGMRIKLTMSGAFRWGTHVIFDASSPFNASNL